jgi:uncharacterized damage-inducible protein DinB
MEETTPFAERNARELDRMRALVARLSDAELAAAANDSWTIAGVLAHIAFWDAHALGLVQKLQRGESFTPDDQEPEDVDWINDATRPLIHAIPPRAAADLAVRLAEETDGAIASLPPELLAHTWPSDPASPLYSVRAEHRSEHLDDIEAALRG